jgi:hypothetical protein
MLSVSGVRLPIISGNAIACNISNASTSKWRPDWREHSFDFQAADCQSLAALDQPELSAAF